MTIKLEYVPGKTLVYNFTENKQYYFEFTVSSAMNIGFGLYSNKGLENGYSFYNEDGSVILEGIASVNRIPVSSAQTVYISVNVLDYTLAKYFRLECNHSYDDYGVCQFCNYDKSVPAESYFGAGVSKELPADGTLFLKLEPNQDYMFIGIEFTYSSTSQADFVIEYILSNDEYLLFANNKFLATYSQMIIKIKNNGARGSATIKFSNLESAI